MNNFRYVDGTVQIEKTKKTLQNPVMKTVKKHEYIFLQIIFHQLFIDLYRTVHFYLFSMPSSNSYNHSNHLAYLITEVYRSHIEESVEFRCVIPYMPCMRSVMSDVYTLEQRGKSKEAASRFFHHLRESQEEGKYQVFKKNISTVEKLLYFISVHHHIYTYLVICVSGPSGNF